MTECPQCHRREMVTIYENGAIVRICRYCNCVVREEPKPRGQVILLQHERGGRQ